MIGRIGDDETAASPRGLRPLRFSFRFFSLSGCPARTRNFSVGQEALGLQVLALPLDERIVAVPDAPVLDGRILGGFLAEFLEIPVDIGLFDPDGDLLELELLIGRQIELGDDLDDGLEPEGLALLEADLPDQRGADGVDVARPADSPSGPAGPGFR